jgi:hypothetical protein
MMKILNTIYNATLALMVVKMRQSAELNLSDDKFDQKEERFQLAIPIRAQLITVSKFNNRTVASICGHAHAMGIKKRSIYESASLSGRTNGQHLNGRSI